MIGFRRENRVEIGAISSEVPVFRVGKPSESATLSGYVRTRTGSALQKTMICPAFSTARNPRLLSSAKKRSRPIKRSISRDLRRMTAPSRTAFDRKRSRIYVSGSSGLDSACCVMGQACTDLG
ncbi:hypothetical protein [Tateyamaria sp. syn59]|uniref:hypothetical protein n=1 Tax=Tateyamaria sp. syn59 TaxID=2576942 RepID=UPI0016741F10